MTPCSWENTKCASGPAWALRSTPKTLTTLSPCASRQICACTIQSMKWKDKPTLKSPSSFQCIRIRYRIRTATDRNARTSSQGISITYKLPLQRSLCRGHQDYKFLRSTQRKLNGCDALRIRAYIDIPLDLSTGSALNHDMHFRCGSSVELLELIILPVCGLCSAFRRNCRGETQRVVAFGPEA